MKQTNFVRPTVAIVGGLGFIGQALADHLSEQGYHVIVVDCRAPRNADKAKNLPFPTFQSDINDRGRLESILDYARDGILVHLAALHFLPYCANYKTETVTTNITGTRTLLDVASRVGIKRIIFTSSAAVYKPSCLPHRETDALAPIEVYGRSKLLGESLVKVYARSRRFDFSILRLFNVYGYKDTTPHLISSITKALVDNVPCHVGNLTTCRDYIYISDVVAAISLALSREGRGSIYNVGTGIGYTGAEVIELLSSIVGRDIATHYSDNKTRAVDRPCLKADTSLISSSLAWKPRIGLREGLELTLSHLFDGKREAKCG